MTPGGRGRRVVDGSWALAMGAVPAALVVYYPITRNYFFGDDLLHGDVARAQPPPTRP